MKELSKCGCICHRDPLKKAVGYEHDTKCCAEMNGYIKSTPTERSEEWEKELNDYFWNYPHTVSTQKKIIGLIKSLLQTHGAREYERGKNDLAGAMQTAEENIKLARAQATAETLERVRKEVKKQIWNPKLESGNEMPEDPQRAADEAISYFHDKIEKILQSLSDDTKVK